MMRKKTAFLSFDSKKTSDAVICAFLVGYINDPLLILR
jgi:hypothetical protein